MPHNFPIFVDVSSRLCLVVGGGDVGVRKATALLECGASIRMVAAEPGGEARRLAQPDRVQLIVGRYVPEHLDGVMLVFAATDDDATNRQIAADARRRGLLVNMATSPEEGDFALPAHLRRGELCIAVTTGGASPTLAARIRDGLSLQFGEDYAYYVELLKSLRSYIKGKCSDRSKRAAALEALVDAEAELLKTIRESGPEAARELAVALANAALE